MSNKETIMSRVRNLVLVSWSW